MSIDYFVLVKIPHRKDNRKYWEYNLNDLHIRKYPINEIFVMRFTFFFLITCLYTSCKINGSFQSLYGYQEETMKKCPDLILKLDSSLCSLQNTTDNVYSINGLELKDCLKTIPKALIYIWQPHCHSETCISPIYLQKLCDAQNIELFVVAEYYDCEKMQLNNILDKPLFGIDQDYYNTNLTSKYLTKVWNDLSNSENEVNRKMFVLFEYGIPTQSKSHVEEILTIAD